MGIRAVSHVAICVSDLERSIAFYRDALGFELKQRFRAQGPAMDSLLELDRTLMELAFLALRGSLVELVHFENPGCLAARDAVANRLGYTHLSLRVDDLGEALAELRKRGISIRESTRAQSESSNHEFVFIEDPDGTRIELMGPLDPAAPTMWDALED